MWFLRLGHKNAKHVRFVLLRHCQASSPPGCGTGETTRRGPKTTWWKKCAPSAQYPLSANPPEAPSQSHPAQLTQIPKPENHENNEMIVVLVPKFWVICSVAIDNQNNLSHLFGYSDCCRMDVSESNLIGAKPQLFARNAGIQIIITSLGLVTWAHRLSQMLYPPDYKVVRGGE